MWKTGKSLKPFEKTPETRKNSNNSQKLENNLCKTMLREGRDFWRLWKGSFKKVLIWSLHKHESRKTNTRRHKTISPKGIKNISKQTFFYWYKFEENLPFFTYLQKMCLTSCRILSSVLLFFGVFWAVLQNVGRNESIFCDFIAFFYFIFIISFAKNFILFYWFYDFD